MCIDARRWGGYAMGCAWRLCTGSRMQYENGFFGGGTCGVVGRMMHRPSEFGVQTQVVACFSKHFSSYHQ